MSKKKNTLNDLEEFLKMQASALVTPAPLGDQPKEAPIISPKVPTRAANADISEQTLPAVRTESDLIEAIKKVSSGNKKAFYDLLIKVTESLPNRSKEDVLLINAALYLKGGQNWKDVVREYWKKS
jgi:hypothetical protein